MKILMLGWEYPPHISGGLGTACQGLTTALSKLGVDIDFVIPHLFGNEQAAHMNLVDSYLLGRPAPASQKKFVSNLKVSESVKDGNSLSVITVPAMLTPYVSPQSYKETLEFLRKNREKLGIGSRIVEAYQIEDTNVANNEILEQLSQPVQYGPDLFSEVNRFTRNVLEAAGTRSFDLIHAHDWMTYLAGIALSRASEVPLVLHVHSLEYDRSGNSGNPRIIQIERAGLEAAQTIIAVSYYTRSVIHEQYGIPLDKIHVVHNGVYSPEILQVYKNKQPAANSKMVLFLGRVTFQKGPDYFVEAAAKVAPILPDVKFVIAGSGDMLPDLMNRVVELGLEGHFVFTGFLRGQEVEEIFSMADLYIMPSVSEPFGITPLEAMSHDIPVIISRQSGVAEVLNHALKVDFWDVDRLAHLMISVLKYPEIREDIVTMAREEVRRFHWDAAAVKTLNIYRQVLDKGGLQ